MSVFKNAAYDGHEFVHFAHDPDTGLRAIIAVHSTALGPAAGGCRMWPYASDADALTDALRLARGMSYKNAMAELPLGGGKAVIIGDARHEKSPELFAAFGAVVDGLGGRYVTAEDVGVNEADMATVATATRHVSGLPKTDRDSAGGNPSPKTARGVFVGIRAAARAAFQRSDVAGLSVAVQGLGGVGYNLCRELHAAGARLVVADLNTAVVEQACDEFAARAVPVDEILFEAVDVVAPCALGGILNADSIPRLKARVIAGGANNQLLTDADGLALHQRGIVYAPDYVINAGGIINVAAEYLESMDEDTVWEKIDAIEGRLLQIFDEARGHDMPTNAVADNLAQQRIRLARDASRATAAAA